MGVENSIFGSAGSNDEQMFNCIFQLRFTAKRLTAQSKRLTKQSKQCEVKIKTCYKKKEYDICKVHGEMCIKKKEDSLRCLQMASRIDGIVSILQNARQMKVVTLQLVNVTKSLQINQNDSFSLLNVAKIMDVFSTQLENLGIMEKTVNESIDKTTSTIINDDDVVKLIQEVADEENLNLAEKLPDLSTLTINNSRKNNVKNPKQETITTIRQKQQENDVK